MPDAATAESIAHSVDWAFIRTIELGHLTREIAGGICVLQMHTIRAAADRSPLLDSEEPEELAWQKARFVLADHLAIKSDRHAPPRRCEPEIVARELIAGLLRQRLVIVVTGKKIPECTRSAGPTFAAPKSRARQ